MWPPLCLDLYLTSEEEGGTENQPTTSGKGRQTNQYGMDKLGPGNKLGKFLVFID